ncbi:MAG: helix-turn-helix domain-containing protein [Acidobacteriota bacterium]|nr:helix-turn-helix domain-containing protein [Acidobacteriota bacterium]MDH3785168.1 helix-turn-helix domain-containing protein [Acidobacteriota bacterium]
MPYKVNFSLASSDQIESALARRLEAIRLSRNITQSQLAREAGVSLSTISRLVQDGKGISLDSFIRILQALKLHGHLEALLPDPAVNPLERIKGRGKRRQRARPKTKESAEWSWGEDPATR